MELFKIFLAVLTPVFAAVIGQILFFTYNLKQKRRTFFYKNIIIFRKYIIKVLDDYEVHIKNNEIKNDKHYFMKIHSEWYATVIQSYLVRKIKINNDRLEVTKIISIPKKKVRSEIVKQLNFIEIFLSKWIEEIDDKTGIDTKDKIEDLIWSIGKTFLILKNIEKATKVQQN